MKSSPKTARVFLLRLAQALHKSGFPSGHLEGIVGSLEKKMGVRANLVSLPTAILGDFGDGEKRNSFILRVQPGEMDLEKQVALHELSLGVSAGRISLPSAVRRISAIESARPRPACLAEAGRKSWRPWWGDSWWHWRRAC